MRRLVGLVLVLAALGVPRTEASTTNRIWSGRYSVMADGQRADGWLAYPTGVEPDTLLVFGHGCCGPFAVTWAERFALHHARDSGLIAVAMDYRGPANGWNVRAGSADLVAATLDLQRRFHPKRTIAWGMSMGGEVTGMAVAARPDLYDYWISSMGVLDLRTQWAQQTFRTKIEAEAGGTPTSAPAEYDLRSPTTMAARMSGIARAYLLHGSADTAVPWSQTQQMFDELRRAGVPASAYTISTGDKDATVWWPTYRKEQVPVGPGGHDVSTVTLAERILAAIVAGHPPDAGVTSAEHVWDATLDVMTP